MADDPRHRRIGFGVVDVAGLTIQTVAGREWRLEARLAFLALHRFDQGRFFAADIATKTVVRVQIEAEIAAQNVFAQVARRARLLDGGLEAFVHLENFPVDVVVPLIRPHHVGGDQHAFNHGMGVILQDVAILERARLALVGVTNQVFLPRKLARHEAPLEPGGKTRTAAPAQG